MAQPADAFVPVPFPPPPARPEFVPKRPSATAVWVDGEWRWARRRWSWVYGRWVEPPEGARFSLSAWRRDASGQLYYAAGRWRDEQGAPVAEPRPLALANADEGDVLEDVGILEDVGPNVVAGVTPTWRGLAPAPCRNPPDIDDPAVPEVKEPTDAAERRPAEAGAPAMDDCGSRPEPEPSRGD